MNKKMIIRRLVMGILMAIAPFAIMVAVTCVGMLSAVLSGGTSDPHYNWVTIGLFACFLGMFLLPIGIIVIVVSLIRLWRLRKEDRIAQHPLSPEK